MRTLPASRMAMWAAYAKIRDEQTETGTVDPDPRGAELARRAERNLREAG